MRIDIVSLFPEMFEGPFASSIVARAIAVGAVEIGVVGLRRFGVGVHHVTDDQPYGGGVGMLMRPEPLVEAVEWTAAHHPSAPHVVLTAAAAPLLTQTDLERWARLEHLIVIAGHYEGVDQRVVEILKAEERSIGSFVLTGGELPAMVIVDGVVRLLPGVLGAPEAPERDSYSGTDRLLEAPQYTRPPSYRGLEVPVVLRSGDHARVGRWQAEESERRTRRLRPDLLEDPEPQ